MTDIVEPASADAIDFLLRWDPGGPWPLVAISPTTRKDEKPIIRLSTLRDVDQLTKWLDKHNGRWNIYFVPNRCLEGLTTSPERQQMTFMRCYHIDLDEDKKSTPSEDEPTYLLERLHKFTPQPHIITFTGGGYQAFWLFAKELDAKEYMQRVEDDNKYLLKQVDGDGSCWNANRLMRLPGTVNVLNFLKRERGRKPALARVVAANWDLPLFRIGKDPAPHIEDESPPGPFPDNTVTDELSVDKSKRESLPFVAELEDLPVKLRRAILKGDASKYGNDRSKLVWHIACALARRQWSEDSIVQILLNRQYGCAAHIYDQANPDRYAANQARKAHEEVKSDWQRSDKGQILRDSQANVRKAISMLDAHLGYNSFDERVYISWNAPLKPFTDKELRALWFAIEDNFGFLPTKDFFFEVAMAVAEAHTFNPLRQYLDRMQPTWDGKERLKRWLTDYGGAAETEFNEWAGILTLVSAVRRARQPGCKHDEMLVLVSEVQGTNKSSALAILATQECWFTDSFPLHAKDKVVLEHLMGKWIVECQELAGIRHAQVEDLKALLSKQTDRARLAYARMPTELARQSIFVGTTNTVDFLRDVENRRFWPVEITRFDLEALRRDRDQLWAEAAVLEATGMSIQLPQQLWPVAAEIQRAHRAEEPWAAKIESALQDVEGRISSTELWKIIDKPIYQRTQTDSNRLGTAMRELGWGYKQFRVPWSKNPKYFFYHCERGKNPNELPFLYVSVDEMSREPVVGQTPTSTQFEEQIKEETPERPDDKITRPSGGPKKLDENNVPF